MQAFKDLEGRTWDVNITIAAVRRVKRMVEIDLLDTGGTIEALMHDVPRLCDVLFAVLKPQADTLGVSDEQFGESLAGDVIDAAVNAFLNAWVSFSPPAQRAVLTRAVDSARRVSEKLRKAAETVLDETDLDALTEAEMRRRSTRNSSTDAPASSVSIPAA